MLIDFLEQRWGTASRETLHQRVAIFRSFFSWGVRTGRIDRDPTVAIRTPKRTRVVRFVPNDDLVAHIVAAQPLRDQTGLSACRALRSAVTSSVAAASATST